MICILDIPEGVAASDWLDNHDSVRFHLKYRRWTHEIEGIIIEQLYDYLLPESICFETKFIWLGDCLYANHSIRTEYYAYDLSELRTKHVWRVDPNDICKYSTYKVYVFLDDKCGFMRRVVG